MDSYRNFGSLLIGISVSMWGVGLLNDPWSQERFERMVRENGRLNNEWIKYIDWTLDQAPIIAYTLMVAAFSIMNRIRLLSLFATVPVIVLGALYYNPNMLLSERFGSNKSIVGMLFIFALFGCIIKSSFNTRKEVEERKESKAKMMKIAQEKATEKLAMQVQKPKVKDDKIHEESKIQ